MASEDIFEKFSEEFEMHLNSESVVNEIEESEADGSKLMSSIDENDHRTNSINENNGLGEKAVLENHERKLLQLPMARIKNLMKLDPDLNIASNEAVFLSTRATELFIESLVRECFLYTSQSKKKIIRKRDLDQAISDVDCLMFLDGAMNF